MKLMITGANGQLGRELQRLLALGESGLGPVNPALKNAAIIAVDLPELDIGKLGDVCSRISQEQPDIIINCAAYTNVNGCETNCDTAFQANAIGARNMAVAAQKCGAKLIHISTDYVFSGNATAPYREWDACDPQSVYGFSKKLGEQYVQEFCSRYFIVRTAWLYGLEGNNFVKTILKTAKEKGALKVVCDQRGNPTNAEDLAHHILELCTTEEYGIYHCTGSGECSWYDFSCEIVRAAKIACTVTPCTTEEFPSPAKRPAYSVLDHQMLRCSIGDNMRPWKDALSAFLAIYMTKSGDE